MLMEKGYLNGLKAYLMPVKSTAIAVMPQRTGYPGNGFLCHASSNFRFVRAMVRETRLLQQVTALTLSRQAGRYAMKTENIGKDQEAR